MIIIVNNLENGVLKIMSWNWLGWLSWICAIAFFCYVIHYIRVKQLMLIAKTKKVFKLNLVIREIDTYYILCFPYFINLSNPLPRSLLFFITL